ncbi:DUF948 domain-containing protein [Virgibacillus xinjiangensis]|uniref:DUF948 domain-containing protein n=1 Tax=Virgibacillus xinjiangensis TaxID=393090 RepID=A0ABV7CX19_9BACI
MTLTGIGVLLIGIAFLVLAIFLANTLQHMAGLLKGVEKTVDRLPDQLDDVMKETGNLISESNNTLADVNEKMEQVTPFFQLAGDMGDATRKLSSSLVEMTEALKQKSDDASSISGKNNLGGMYGSFALGYYLLQKKRKARSEGASTDDQ